MRALRFPAALLLVFFAISARAGDFANLLEKGEFFLEKGTAYAPDAVRSLEEAADTDPGRASKDARFVAAMAKAYARTFRYSEAYFWLRALEREGKTTPATDAVRDYLLNEAGVGRLTLRSRFPVAGVTGTFRAGDATRLDVTGRKVLEKLNEWFAKPRSLDAAGTTLLLPEGEYRLSSNRILTSNGEQEQNVEVWGGDEKELLVVAEHPAPGQWQAVPGNRSVKLTWPAAEGMRYRLLRAGADGKEAVRYEGPDSAFTDTGVPPGETVAYRLLTFGADGVLYATAGTETTAMPPVTEVGIDASLQGDLRVAVLWWVGEGSLDRLVVLREGERGDEVLLDAPGNLTGRQGDLRDGPVVPAPGEQRVTYRIEAWVDGEQNPATARRTVVIPPEVARMDRVDEQISPKEVTVQWYTIPVDSIAEGYAVYLIRNPGGIGELVGRVANAHAREFGYVPKSGEPSAQWRHMVLPYVGKRFLVPPVPLSATDEDPVAEFEQRAKRRRAKLPELALSWRPYPNTRRYLVRVGEEEKIINNDYIEFSGLQSAVVGGQYPIEVFALPPGGKMVPIISMDLRYDLYESK